jgi:protein-disulfide isomerase
MTGAANRTPAVVGLAGADHTVGDASAPLVLVQYGDYDCPHCMALVPALRELLAAHAKSLRFVYRHFPIFSEHPKAELAAEAAEAAAAQDRFWDMHWRLYAGEHAGAGRDISELNTLAESLGLDLLRFRGEMADRIYTQRVHEHQTAGQRSGVKTVPTFFLNGQVMTGVGADLAPLRRELQAMLGKRA